MVSVTNLANAGRGINRTAQDLRGGNRSETEQATERKWNDRFRSLSTATSTWMGRPWAFLTAILIIVAWGITGPFFHFSDTWQLVINTGTTIITFLMVFLIQNTQNRDAKAIHLKLDELIHAVHGARNKLVNLESLSDEELAKLEAEFAKLGKRYGKLADQSEKTAEGPESISRPTS